MNYNYIFRIVFCFSLHCSSCLEIFGTGLLFNVFMQFDGNNHLDILLIRICWVICRSVYYAATDVVILRFMIEVCWAPMLAAFSVPLDQSDDEVVIALCLEGFRYAIHVTAVMSMKTHRDAFVTSLAKFTSLHSPADIKQKNIDAIKVGMLFTIIDTIKD